MATRKADLNLNRKLPLLSYQDAGDFICAFKRQDLNTHASDSGKTGLVEILERQMGQKLFVVHRLDKATSGLILLAKNSECAAQLAKLFEEREIKKTYYFLTDRKREKSGETANSLTRKSFIEKKGQQFVSDSTEPCNSETHFTLIQDFDRYQLWMAQPLTGKPHQIRLHAQDLGIPILGDLEHKGSPAWRMFLQAQELEFEYNNKKFHFKAEDLNWNSADPTSISFKLEQAYSTRKQIFGEILPDQCFRLVHGEDLNLRIDKLGKVLWVYWYYDQEPTPEQIQEIQNWAHSKSFNIFVVKMNNRGAAGTETQMWDPDQIPSTWNACENSVQYEFRNNTGLSAGLFLDQRENRLWVHENSSDKKVLNLFSYTSGFSVAAALGQAKEVVTVDVSAKFLEWSKRNFELNNISLKVQTNYQFFCQDSLLFLKGTQKRERKFDLVICDPPSMGRSKEGVFSLKKDWKELITRLLAVTERNGIILFSTNFEAWSKDELKSLISKEFKKNVELLDTPIAGLDYETPDQVSLLKSIFIRKLL